MIDPLLEQEKFYKDQLQQQEMMYQQKQELLQQQVEMLTQQLQQHAEVQSILIQNQFNQLLIPPPTVE